MTNPFDLSGKVALVTGGRRGLCLAMTEGLARAGARIAVADIAEDYRELARRMASIGAEMEYFRVDLTDRAQRGELVNRVVNRFGRLDILVNGAGIQHRQPAMEFDLGKWDTIISLMLTAVFEVCAAGSPRHGKGGRR